MQKVIIHDFFLAPSIQLSLVNESDFGKLALTFFRIAAMFGIAWYLVKMNRKGVHTGFYFASH